MFHKPEIFIIPVLSISWLISVPRSTADIGGELNGPPGLIGSKERKSDKAEKVLLLCGTVSLKHEIIWKYPRNWHVGY